MKPTKIHLHKQTQNLDITFNDITFSLSAEYLRVHSPSAEVKGHQGIGGAVPFGKKNVRIEKIAAAGNYALKIYFDDGHDSGLYTWEYLYTLGHEQKERWEAYLQLLHAEQKTRHPELTVIKLSN